MSANEPSPPAAPNVQRRRPPLKVRVGFWVVALVLGVGIGVAIKLTGGSSSNPAQSAAAETWPAHDHKAPALDLVDQAGKPISLASFHGRPVIVTFIDPLCRDFCPREASILSAAAEQLGSPKPAIVSVSVDPWADTAVNFHQDALHWNLAPGWLWGVGTHAQLAAAWKRYEIGVLVTHKTIAGISVRYITHTGAAYLIDSSGYARALFVYPFTQKDVVTAAQAMSAN